MEQESPSSSLAYLLHHLAFSLERQSDQVLQEQLGIGFAQFKILWTLQVNPHLLQRELADSLSQSEASVSRQVKLLIQKGLVVSRTNPRNKREHQTLPTQKGIRLREAAITVLAKLHKSYFSRLDEKTQQKVEQDLMKVSPKYSLTIKNADYRHLW